MQCALRYVPRNGIRASPSFVEHHLDRKKLRLLAHPLPPLPQFPCREQVSVQLASIHFWRWPWLEHPWLFLPCSHLIRSAVVGEVDEVADAEIDLDEVKAEPIPQVIY